MVVEVEIGAALAVDCIADSVAGAFAVAFVKAAMPAGFVTDSVADL